MRLMMVSVASGTARRARYLAARPDPLAPGRSWAPRLRRASIGGAARADRYWGRRVPAVSSPRASTGAARTIYDAYQAQEDLAAPMRALSAIAAGALHALPPGAARASCAGRWPAASSSRRAASRTSGPPSGDTVPVAGHDVPVAERVLHATPFGTLLHFAKETDAVQPRVLVVAPLAGHFSTLLRATARTLLRDHGVFVADWHNARDVAVGHGRFGLDEYVQHVVDFLGVIGPGAHVLAVCQPCVPTLAATAVMAEDGHAATPRSVTLMAGPVDARINPTAVNGWPRASHSRGSSRTSSPPCRCATAAPCAGSTPASCRWAPS